MHSVALLGLIYLGLLIPQGICCLILIIQHCYQLYSTPDVCPRCHHHHIRRCHTEQLCPQCHHWHSGQRGYRGGPLRCQQLINRPTADSPIPPESEQLKCPLITTPEKGLWGNIVPHGQVMCQCAHTTVCQCYRLPVDCFGHYQTCGQPLEDIESVAEIGSIETQSKHPDSVNYREGAIVEPKPIFLPKPERQQTVLAFSGLQSLLFQDLPRPGLVSQASLDFEPIVDNQPVSISPLRPKN